MSRIPLREALRSISDVERTTSRTALRQVRPRELVGLAQTLARAQQLSAQARQLHRQQHAAPVLAKLRAWLEASLPGVPPGTLTGKALNYLNNEWPKLVRYLEDGRLEIDNNLAENAIRPFVIGRKNWLFSDSVHGVKASANLYSLVETAKANGLEPYQYLRQGFTVLPQADTVEAIESLLPWAVKKIPAETR